MSKRRFFETEFRITVLSEDAPVHNLDLPALVEAMDAGPCIGLCKPVATKTLTRKQVVDELYALGGDPSFFRLDEQGKDAD